MRVLVGCEFSQVVTKAFRDKGHDAYSCDLLPTEGDSKHHIRCDVLEVIDDSWDLAIFHPPCTFLAVSGARWFSDRPKEQEEALEFVRLLLNAPIKRIALENPIGVISTKMRKPDQIIQPWQFGHGETKATCLWLKSLPLLQSTNVVDGRDDRIYREPPSSDRWKIRSRTFQGIASAMSSQWSNPITLDYWLGE